MVELIIGHVHQLRFHRRQQFLHQVHRRQQFLHQVMQCLHQFRSGFTRLHDHVLSYHR